MSNNAHDIKPGKRITVTSKNEDTINSDHFKSFVWREKEDYEHGQLTVMFKQYGAYMYDVPYSFFEEMAKRAYNPEKYEMLKSFKCVTPYEYYDTNMITVVDKDESKPLYEEKYKYND